MNTIKTLYNNQLYLSDIDTCIRHIVNLSQLKNKNVLVTGATGLIGSFIVDIMHRLNEKLNFNIKIYALGRSIKRLNDRFTYLENGEDVFFIEQDIVKEIGMYDVDLDYCIHAASNAYPEVMYNDPVGTIMANVNGTYNLLHYLKRNNGKRFLFVSSGEVYGSCKDIYSFTEFSSGTVDLLNVRSCYPLSKRAAENLCIAFSEQYGMEIVIVRPSHTYGPNNKQNDNRANVQFVENALRHKPIILKSSGQQLRSYTYIADTCSGLLSVMLYGENQAAYNLSNSKSIVTIRNFAEIVAKKGNVDIFFEDDSSQASPFDRAVLDNKRLEDLGWNAEYDIEEGIQHTMEISRWMKC